MSPRPYSIVAIFVVLSSLLRADQVGLKNGDRVSGKLVKKEGKSLQMKTDLMGNVTIPWDAVVSVTSDNPLFVTLANGRFIAGTVRVNVDEKKLEVITPTTTESAPLSDLVAIRNEPSQQQYERLESPSVLQVWDGFVDLGLSAARGNARTNTLTSAFNASRVTRTDKTTLYFNQIYASALVEDQSDVTAEAIRAGWSYKKDVSPRIFISLFNDYAYDAFQDLDLRFVIGGGAGYIAIKDQRKRLDLTGGWDYNREQYSTPLTRNAAEAFWGDDFSFKLNTAVELAQRFRMFHYLTNSGPYRMDFDLSAVTNLNRWLSWQATVSDRFLSNPVPGRQRNDILYTTGFRIRFAR